MADSIAPISTEKTLNEDKSPDDKPIEDKPTELEPTEVKAAEVEPTEVKAAEVEPTEVKAVEVKPTEVKAAEVKPNEVNAAEVEPNEVNAAEVKPTEVNAAEVKPTEVKAAEVEPNEVNAAEVKPTEVKAAEVEPNEAKQSVKNLISDMIDSILSDPEAKQYAIDLILNTIKSRLPISEPKQPEVKQPEVKQPEVKTTEAKQPVKNSISDLIVAHFTLFNLGLTSLFSIALIYLVAVGPYCASETDCKPDFWMTLSAMLTFFFAGGLGGAVCNLRGFFEYYTDKGALPETFFVPYCVRPWMGAGSGLIAFFVLSFLNTALSNANSLAWTTFSGRIPYIGLALLAGFGSREFMERLKETAKAAFSGSSKQQSEVSANTMATWGEDGAGPENLQVNKDEIVLLAGNIEKKGEFKWKIFRDGEPIPKTAGKSTAISFSGGSDEDRRAKAKEQARLRAEGEGISDWETLEIQ